MMIEKELEQEIIEFEKWWRKRITEFNSAAPIIIREWYRFLEEKGKSNGSVTQGDDGIMDSNSIREKD